MQFRVQFLDGSANVAQEHPTRARNAAHAVELAKYLAWPPRALRMRILDLDGIEVHTANPGGVRRAGLLAGVVRWFQTGYIYHYAFAMLLGVIVLMTYFVSWPMLQPLLSGWLKP